MPTRWLIGDFFFFSFFFSLVIRGETVWSKVSMKLEHRVQQNHERQHGQHSTQNESTAGVSVGRAVPLNRWCSSPITVKPSGVICSLTLMPADCINAWNDKFSWSVNVGPEGGAHICNRFTELSVTQKQHTVWQHIDSSDCSCAL